MGRRVYRSTPGVGYIGARSWSLLRSGTPVNARGYFQMCQTRDIINSAETVDRALREVCNYREMK